MDYDSYDLTTNWTVQQPETTDSTTTETPDRLTDGTYAATMQVRWALLDPSHDKAATERCLATIEQYMEDSQLERYALGRSLTKAEANEAHYKEQLKSYKKAYEGAYEAQSQYRRMTLYIGEYHLPTRASW